MTISAATSSAAGISTSRPSACSSDAANERRRGGVATSPAARVTSACAMTAPYTRAFYFDAFSSREPGSIPHQVRDRPRLKNAMLRQLADGFFQQIPRLVAVFTFPFGIEAGHAQLLPERRDAGLVEGQSFAGQFLLQARIQLGDVGALVNRGGVDVLGD